MFGRKKKKDDTEALQKTSSNKIQVRVFKDFGSDTQFLKAVYMAEERRDIYNNLISVNKEFKHEEDTDFSMDDVYRSMQVILEFKSLDKPDRIKILQSKITEQEKLVQYLNKFVELNAIYNMPDEQLKLKDYRIMKNHIQHHDDRGCYFTIENGIRVYSFQSQDGFLIPIWHGIDTYSQYPDHTRKLKITIQEDQRMRQELALMKKEKLVGNVLIVGLIFCIILFALLLAAAIKLWDLRSNFDKQIAELSYSCVQHASNALSGKISEPIPQPEQQTTNLDPKNILNAVG